MMVFFKKHATKILFLLLLICISIWGYTAYNRHLERKKQTPGAVAQQVKVFAPEARDVVVERSYIGRVEAINDTQIVPYISGYVIGINAVGGQSVKKGEVLATLKQDEYLAQVASAEASVYAAKADYLNAKIKYKRMAKAGAQAVSQTEIDDAKTAYMSASGALEEAQAAYLTAQTNLQYTYLTAPFDGVVGNMDVSLGDYVSSQGKALTRLVQYNPIRVVYSVTDKEYLNDVADNSLQTNKLKIRLANGKVLPQTGKVKYTANAVNTDTNSVAIYSEFENAEHQLMPEAYVNVMQEKKYNKVVLIPKNLVQLKSDGDYVYTVIGDVLRLHKIDVLAEYQNNAVVRNDFETGEFIVAEVVQGNLLGQKIKTEKAEQK